MKSFAYINALAEEGTIVECMMWVERVRKEKEGSGPDVALMTKQQCIDELYRLETT